MTVRIQTPIRQMVRDAVGRSYLYQRLGRTPRMAIDESGERL